MIALMASHFQSAALMTMLALCACGAESQPDPSTPSAAPDPVSSPAGAAAPAPRDPGPAALLADLRSRLERVRSAADDAHVTENPVDAAALVGMHRDMVMRALGEPRGCAAENGALTPAPCEHATDVFYSFYHLPEGSVGGGPEMLVRFEGDRVSQVLWRFTQ